MQQLLHSRKFWIMIVDVVVSMIMYFGAKYFGAALEDIRFLILTLQPVILFVIGAIAVEDVAGINAGSKHPLSK